MIAILEAHRAGLLGRAHLAPNLLAGVVVGIVALPLAMAFAIASGARPEQGLYTAIVAGLCATLFGGTRLQISGPTGAFVAVLAVITAQHGIAGLQVATLMAGLILLAMGAARLGSVIRYIPDPVIVGFTSGIALIIFVGQWPYFFGLAAASRDAHFHERLATLAGQLPQAHLATTGLGLLTLAVLAVGTRCLKRVPSPLVAMVLATALQAAFAFDGVATIGTAFGGLPRELPSFGLPRVDFGMVVQLLGPAFTIALLGAIESLLSATVADGMAGTRHDSNQELVGQGVANVLAPLFGGFAATGAIARTATNVRNGATGPLAGIVHCAFLGLVIVAAAPLAAHVPLAALAAILFYVAWNMAEAHRFARLVRTAPRPDVAVLLITFALTVLTDLVVAVNVGVVLASLLFMRRMAQAVRVETHSHPELAPTEALPPGTRVPADTAVYTIDGPFFFGAAEKLESALRRSQSRVRTVVIRMGRVPFVDTTGLNALDEIVDDFRRNGTHVVLCELRDNVRLKLERAGILAKVGEDGAWDSLEAYLRTRVA